MSKALQALVIEDNFDIAEIFSHALEAAGFDTEIIYDGAEALERLQPATTAHWAPDVIALDLHLPHVSGIDLLRAIRADERLASTRVILVTADQGLAQSVAEQADLVLLKPVSFTQLQVLAQRIVEKPRRK